MPARNRPTAEDAATARRVLLDGIARDVDIFELLSELVPLHPRNDTFPGEVFLQVAADVLDWCGANRADPLPLEGLRERFLPECAFRGRQNAKLQYAALAAAAVHGGTEPDLLDEVASWQTDDFWEYAFYAAVAYIRAAASGAGVPVRQACQDLDERPGHPEPTSPGPNLNSADLSGAAVAGANFAKVTWSDTTCPDGTNSDADGGTCTGQL